MSPAITRSVLVGAATATLLLGLTPGLASADADSEDPVSEVPSGASGSSGSLSGTVGGGLLADTGTVLPEGAPPLTSFATARSFVIAEAATGEVIAARDPHGRYAPGGVHKMLTALTLIPKIDKGEKVTVTKKHLSDGGSRAGLVAGTEYKAEDLFYGLMLASGNDAANALVDAAPGGSAIGLAAMRGEAKRLQANDTVVVNATGMSESGQVTSAYDTALMAREGLRNGDFARYVAAEEHVAKTSHGNLTWTNGNKLLGKYPGTLGVKTGETPPAGGSYVGAVTRDGRTLLLTILAATDKVAPMAMEMYDWAFDLPADLEPVGELVAPVGPPTTSFVTTAGELEAYGESSAATAEGDGESGTDSGTDTQSLAGQAGASSGDSAGESSATGAAPQAATSETSSGGLGFGTEAVLSLALIAFAGVAILLLSTRAVPATGSAAARATVGQRPLARQPGREAPRGAPPSARAHARPVPVGAGRRDRPARAHRPPARGSAGRVGQR